MELPVGGFFSRTPQGAPFKTHFRGELFPDVFCVLSVSILQQTQSVHTGARLWLASLLFAYCKYENMKINTIGPSTNRAAIAVWEVIKL